MKRRVVVTGIGTVNPTGNSVAESWDSIKNGKIGIGEITCFDTEGYKVKVAAEVKDFDPTGKVDKRELRHTARFTLLAQCAAEEAIKDSGLCKNAEGDYSYDTPVSEIAADRCGVIISSGIGGLDEIEKNHSKSLDKGNGFVSPFFVPMSITNMAAARIAIAHGFKGMCTCPVTACAGGSNAIGDAFFRIRDGYEDAMICGGTESSITPLGIAGFQNMKALSETTDPARASIPFDKDRNGFVMGEGSGILVLEEYEHAKSRGAHIYAEIVGYGSNCDAYHITSPAPGGEGGAACMKLAIKDAGITESDIDYINAHGTSTSLNDKYETAAIKTVFGEKAKDLYVSSTKSMTGHLLGGAGGVEAVFCVKALEDSFVPPTASLKETDPEMDLNYVPGKGIEKELNYVLSNSLGFGGHNACLIFKKYKS
ncbi:beta-ketoacyl-ACP synthase II [Butyrivibrio sp. WCD2001]|uniref:beta-ketoacyl-ACP synthase II n=1 Tax=Butyrivibrio sp. WCD2001 TaxID=1280681 RepID=UPI0003F5A6A4|nr:beta-ketoacyl-ACP synthase II [Butyrivibrio sp. WCD2001]